MKWMIWCFGSQSIIGGFVPLKTKLWLLIWARHSLFWAEAVQNKTMWWNPIVFERYFVKVIRFWERAREKQNIRLFSKLLSGTHRDRSSQIWILSEIFETEQSQVTKCFIKDLTDSIMSSMAGFGILGQRQNRKTWLRQVVLWVRNRTEGRGFCRSVFEARSNIRSSYWVFGKQNTTMHKKQCFFARHGE